MWVATRDRQMVEKMDVNSAVVWVLHSERRVAAELDAMKAVSTAAYLALL